ncbi:hypothetical protein RP20_CCG012677 [Aedes albopictus]|nr:hypothetical protein RP20_CCG012677 [Aedes albopictus]
MSGSRLFTAIAVIAFITAARGAPQEVIEALVRYKQQCIAMSGSTEGYKEILNAIPNIKTCIFKRVDILEIEQDATSISESKVDRKIFFDKYCPRFNESVGCFDDLFEGMAKCTGEDSDEIFPVLRDVAYGIEWLEEPLEKFLVTRLQEFLEESMEKFLDESPEELLEEFLEEFLEDILEKSLKNFLEESLEEFLEESLKKILEQSLAKSLEEFLELSLEEYLEEFLEELLEEPFKNL